MPIFDAESIPGFQEWFFQKSEWLGTIEKQLGRNVTAGEIDLFDKMVSDPGNIGKDVIETFISLNNKDIT